MCIRDSLVVGLEPILQTVVVMVGTGRVAGNIGPRAVGVALLLDGLEDEAVDVVVELRVGRRLDAALRLSLIHISRKLIVPSFPPAIILKA